MELITETIAYKGLTQAIQLPLEANGRNLDNRTYTNLGHKTIIELAHRLMDIRRNYVNNQEVSKW